MKPKSIGIIFGWTGRLLTSATVSKGVDVARQNPFLYRRYYYDRGLHFAHLFINNMQSGGDMQERNIYTYRPNRSYIIVFYICASILIVSFALVVIFTNSRLVFAISFIVALVLMSFLRTIYDSSNTVVSFESDGIRIFDGVSKEYHHLLWNNISYAYQLKNYKGFNFLVLSQEQLTHKELKHSIDRISLKTVFNGVVVIWLDYAEKIEAIVEMFEENGVKFS